MSNIPTKYRSILIPLALAVVTFVVFYQVHSFQFVNYDDPGYIYKNPNVQAGISLASIKWALTASYAAVPVARVIPVPPSSIFPLKMT